MKESTLQFKEITDKGTWNSFVIKQPRYSFLQSWQYANVQESLSSNVKRIGVYQGNTLVGLLCMLITRAKRGSYLKMKHGPLLEPTLWQDKHTLIQVHNYLASEAKKLGLSFVRIHPLIEDASVLHTIGYKAAPTHNLDAEHTLHLTLPKKDTYEEAEQELQKNMRKNTRYSIRKAFKNGVEVKVVQDDFELFYDLLSQSASRQGYTMWPKKYFESLYANFDTKERTTYIAYFENTPIAMGLFLDFGKYRFYLEGGMNSDYQKQLPTYAIQWQSISDALRKGQEVYDFWGGVAPDNAPKGYPWAGIDLFKRGFGGERVSMIHTQDYAVSWKYYFTSLFERVEKWRRGY
jgi:lipid II:glycine glycyltransferase (peptidoglycan interpeptide bridge formation enzyme)